MLGILDILADAQRILGYLSHAQQHYCLHYTGWAKKTGPV